MTYDVYERQVDTSGECAPSAWRRIARNATLAFAQEIDQRLAGGSDGWEVEHKIEPSKSDSVSEEVAL